MLHPHTTENTLVTSSFSQHYTPHIKPRTPHTNPNNIQPQTPNAPINNQNKFPQLPLTGHASVASGHRLHPPVSNQQNRPYGHLGNSSRPTDKQTHKNRQNPSYIACFTRPSHRQHDAMHHHKNYTNKSTDVSRHVIESNDTAI